MTSHLIFDFFGTLVDYSPSRTEQGYPQTFDLYRTLGGVLAYDDFVQAWSDAFTILDERTASDHREYSMQEASSTFMRSASLEGTNVTADSLARSYLREWNAGVRDIPGVAPMLQRLARSFDLALITNTHDPELVPSHLERLGVARAFERVVTSVELGRRKPSPAIFEHTMAQLDTAPAQCIYIGDSLVHDFQGARSVGMRALLVDPASTSQVAANERIGSILDLEPYVATL